ncbi:chromosome segregation protein SMC [Ammoniphilus oxalaticus]|uniref:Chromosome partition protein Smc n=1 Tax=Ammoniphilus oxalaticus TaxID=66863 RepID=A0A419SJI1_9BACL|nr:chromosome segregation protein SMC [Ammoniphilus oxalaticus]RKD24173.1 chromosome segregation protein SMC [Ammoniphilus oxalaticus]
MFLKRLELVGFKSFAKRTELAFGSGVTAVVGPNGSGKSNIADAIRWVLGEQSARSLRGAKMEDIIFAGSAARQAVNYGEVSLTLDNSKQTLKIDYSEVTISRRVYRSGESEYFINKQPCRLRDIVELFMDTGVGREAYSIIGQGKIEEIISARSEDRRGIFEEAAGIVKYKTRKREAEKKLNETAANLTRIEDILSELSTQLPPLQQQAEQAEIYLDLQRELKQRDISLTAHRIESLSETWQTAKESVVGYRDQLVARSAELNAIEAQLAERKWANAEQAQLQQQQQRELLGVIEETEQTEGQRQVLLERAKHIAENERQIAQTKSSLEQKLTQIAGQRAEQEQRLADSFIEAERIEQQLIEQQTRLGETGVGLAVDVDQLKADYIAALNEIAALKNDLRHCEQTGQSLHQKRTQLTEQALATKAQAKQVNLADENLRLELEQRVTKREQAQLLLRQLATEYEQARRKRESCFKRLRDMEQKMQALSSRRDLLKEMEASLSGFRQGVKEVLKAKGTVLLGIHGAVAELMTTSAAYETALEIALGGSLQQVVTEDETVARKAIQWLKDHRLGRATFLPMNVIRPRRISSKDEAMLQGIAGFIGVACDLIACDSRYKAIYENLLGSTMIMKDLATANAAARQFGYRYRWVTIDGEVISPGGAMTGGAIQQKNAHLLGRTRQLEELKLSLKQREQEQQEQADELVLMDMKLQQLTAAQEDTRQLIEQHQANEHETKNKLGRLQVERNNTQQLSRRWQTELSALQEEERANQQRGLTLQAELGERTNQGRQLKQTMDQLDKRRSVLLQAKDEYNDQITQLKIQAAQLQQQQAVFQTELSRLDALEAETKTALAAAEDSQEKQVQTKLEDEARRLQLEQRVIHLQEKRRNLDEQIQLRERARKDSEDQIDQLDSDVRLIRKQSRELEEKLHQAELKVERLDVELDNQLDHLFEEYGLSYDLAKESYPPPQDPAEMKQQAREIKRRLDDLGIVNLGAVDEYARQFERFEFLNVQFDDLEQAKQTLYEVIAEIEREMTRRFTETFEQIRGEFQSVFRHLFGGGQADLQLSEPERLLTSGIEIVAQPPGKKLQYMALLSGGEKALTAIALLFSILRIQPVPFCVLDEVEAALDEANVARFSEYLREFAGQTQFICITHRKGTMEGADVLYGVTMEERGVSKLVSVKLEDQSTVTA